MFIYLALSLLVTAIILPAIREPGAPRSEEEFYSSEGLATSSAGALEEEATGREDTGSSNTDGHHEDMRVRVSCNQEEDGAEDRNEHRDGEDGRHGGPEATKRSRIKSIGAWTIYWDPESHRNLTENPDIFTHVYPYWYTLDEAGNIIPTSDNSSFFGSWLSLYHQMGLSVFPILYSGTNSTYVPILRDPDRRDQHIGEIVNLVLSMGFDGIEINYEALPYPERFTFASFIENLTDELGRNFKDLSVTLYPRSTGDSVGLQCDAYLYEELGRAADMVKLMTYNEHWTTHPFAGPIASYPWVEATVKYASETIDLAKIIIGIPTFGYDWPVDPWGRTLRISRNYTYNEAERVRNLFGAERLWNDTGRCPYYRYYDQYVDHEMHQVHYTDNQSISYLLYLVQKYDLFGISLWHAGGHDNKIYSILREWMASDYSNLPPLAYPGEGRYVETGEILRFNDSVALDIDGTLESIEWDFGDGNTSDRIHPSHSYQHPGLYTVSLTVTDDLGIVDRGTTKMLVGPYANPGPDRAVDEDREVHFDASGSIDRDGIISHTWDFGDGVVAYHSGPVVSHIYDHPGNYTVKLTNINRSGYTATGACRITVRDITPPLAAITESLAVGKNEVFILDASGSQDNGDIVLYRWDLGGGFNADTEEPSIEHSYPDMGNHTVSVTVFDSAGNPDTAFGNVRVRDGDPPLLQVEYDREMPHGRPSRFDAGNTTDNEAVAEYNWSFGDGMWFNSSEPWTEHIYESPGRYIVTLTVLDAAGNWNSTTFHIDVKDVIPPDPVMSISILTEGEIGESYEISLENGTAILSSNDIFIGPMPEDWRFSTEGDRTIIFNCTQSHDDLGIENVTWETGDGYIAYEDVFYYLYRSSGNFTVVLRVRDGEGNTGELAVPVEIFTPRAGWDAPFSPNGSDDGNGTEGEGDEEGGLESTHGRLVGLFWLLFGFIVILVIVMDLAAMARKRETEQNLSYYHKKREINEFERKRMMGP